MSRRMKGLVGSVAVVLGLASGMAVAGSSGYVGPVYATFYTNTTYTHRDDGVGIAAIRVVFPSKPTNVTVRLVCTANTGYTNTLVTGFITNGSLFESVYEDNGAKYSIWNGGKIIVSATMNNTNKCKRMFWPVER